jgi:hypothetical protein
MTIAAKDFCLGCVAAIFFSCGYAVATVQGHYQHDIDHQLYAENIDRLENQLIFADAKAAEVTKDRAEKMKKAGLKNDN